MSASSGGSVATGSGPYPDGQVPVSRWGPGDQVGAAHLIDQAAVSRALTLGKDGRVFDLSQPISSNSPRLPVMFPYLMCLCTNPVTSCHDLEARMGSTNKMGYAGERVEMSLHTGTHIDALGHAWVGDQTYNGRRMHEIVRNWQLLELGIEHLPPVVTRGVLLDVPGALGRDLCPGEVIDVETLEMTCERQSVEVRSGDAVLLRTGWARYYGVDNHAFVTAWPGIGIAGARWMADREVVIVGGDTMAVEVAPDEDPAVHAPVHQFLLAGCGIYLLEQANLDEIAAERIYEFLCLCLAPAFAGATASPVRLTAVA